MQHRGRTRTPPHRGLVPLTAGAGGLLAVLIGLVFLMLVLAIQDAQHSLLSARSGRPALDQMGVVQGTVLDMEGGQRSYVITRQDEFLKPWQAARAAFPAQAQRLVDLSTSPAQRQLARRIQRSGQSFVDDYSVPLVAEARRGDPDASSTARTLEGKQRLDALRAQFSRYLHDERAAISRRENALEARMRMLTITASVGVGAAVLLIVAYGAYVSRVIVWPVRRMARFATRLAAGDLGARVPLSGRREIGQLETAFNTMAGSLEKSHRRLRLLYDAGTALGNTLDVGRTADELVRVAVPRFADFVTVDLEESVLHGGEPTATETVLRRVARGGVRDDSPLDPAGALIAVDPPPGATRHTATAAALIADLRVTRRATFPDARRTEKLLDYGMRSLITVPLSAQGVLMGVIVFWRTRDSPPFEEDDLSDAEELAAKSATAIDNARRYTRERETALALQRSLLPHVMPDCPSVDFAYRYLPTGTRAGVGGDWLDVIPLSGTRIALVVGDVVGHGIEASATMGRLRTAVRTLADVDLPPDELLTHLDDLVLHLDDGAGEQAGELGSTCLYAVYDPVSRHCSLASAGHPLPFVITPQGEVEAAPGRPGPPLGLGGLPFETTDLDLTEGATLALFSNGLVHSRDLDLGHGLDRLRRALLASARKGESLEAACDRVVAALRIGEPADDVTLLLARTRALPADHVAAWEILADPEHVARARTLTTDQLAAWKLDELSFTTELVVSELVTNAVRYGAPPIQLRLIRDTRTLICEVSDGSSTAPHLRRARVSDEGGRGLLLVAQLTRRWGTRQTAAGKTIWCEQALPAPDASTRPQGSVDWCRE
ncbi:MAG: SpoIIE family protein phosphatase [Streptomyces sp.]|uniref:SpoIIE family protein phosphatase n=1 Tax=Streptomyces sp. TaxID=1931 RepID=UPI0025E16ACD|nr:SpoIIE family protein phosphatase [Streptomyces sp.]MBW8794111.1 SpoIIE family protein phosphatase [Streptomyces sp.]